MGLIILLSGRIPMLARGGDWTARRGRGEQWVRRRSRDAER